MSDKKYAEKERNYQLLFKIRKQTRNKEIHEALTLVNLILPQSLTCKTCNARKSVLVKEFKPNKSQNQFSEIKKTNADLLFKM